MKALLVNGSPHTVKGVHVSILDTFEEGLKEAGSEVYVKADDAAE